MTVPPRGYRPVHGLLVAAVVASCAEPSSGPALGSIEVIATTTGASLDRDGYQIRLDGGPARPLGVNAMALYPSIAGGEHRLVLANVAANCAVAGNPERSLSVDAGETATVEFAVACGPTSGNVVIRIVSTGDDVDPNGYTVVIDDASQAEVATSSTAEITISEGEHAVALAGITPNCHIEGENPRRIVVVTGADAVTTFTVTCSAAAPAGPGAEIGFFTDRLHRQDENPVADFAMMNTDGTGVRILSSGAAGPVSWSRAGGKVAVGTGSSILLGAIDDAGNFVEQSEIAGGEHQIYGFSWSPDDTELAYSLADAETDGSAEIHTITVDGASDSVLTCACFDARGRGSPSWVPDGTSIAVSALASLSSDGDFRVDDGIWFIDPHEIFQQPAVSPSFFGTTPAWSPDGARIALARHGPGAPDYDIFITDADGSNPVRLTDSPGDDASPAWSPDGSRIVFVSHRDGNAEIYVMQRDGSNPTRITNNSATDTLPTWRP